MKNLLKTLVILLFIGSMAYGESSPFDIMESDMKNTPSDSFNNSEYRKYANLIALNKITGISNKMKIMVGESAFFGNIELQVHKCSINKNVYDPLSYILLTVTETKIDEDPNEIYKGWIVSSYNSITNLSHPSYEIIAVECTND